VSDGDTLFWDLVEPMYADPAVTRSTMMGLPCVRYQGRFFASLEHRTGALLVKLPVSRVAEVIAAGVGEPFAPAGRIFREWVAVPRPDEDLWRSLLGEARAHAGGGPASPAQAGAAFTGFGTGGLAFLAGLERTNTKAFFDAGRDIYRRELLEPSKRFVVALAAALRLTIGDGLRAEPRVGGSLFRINTDLRFNPDQPPYKPHLDMALWVSDAGPRTDPALLVRLTPAEVHLGTGVFLKPGPRLDRYRAALRDRAAVATLDVAVEPLISGGATLSDPTRRRLPTGFAVDGPQARWAVRDGFHLMRVDQLPDAVTTAGFVRWCADRFAPFGPVLRWLATHSRQDGGSGSPHASAARRPAARRAR
jgi:uncharacterized protein (TIGR02453 family)